MGNGEVKAFLWIQLDSSGRESTEPCLTGNHVNERKVRVIYIYRITESQSLPSKTRNANEANEAETSPNFSDVDSKSSHENSEKIGFQDDIFIYDHTIGKRASKSVT